MHHVFAGAENILCKFFSTLLRPNEVDKVSLLLNQNLKSRNFFLRRSEGNTEMKYWKAVNFKLLFFHINVVIKDSCDTRSKREEGKYSKLITAT